MDACHVYICKHEPPHEKLVLDLWRELHEVGVELLRYADLSEIERGSLRKDYIDNIFPLITPQAIDPAHLFLSSPTFH